MLSLGVTAIIAYCLLLVLLKLLVFLLHDVAVIWYRCNQMFSSTPDGEQNKAKSEEIFPSPTLDAGKRMLGVYWISARASVG